MNEINFADLDALKARTDAVNDYAKRNVYNRLEEVGEQMRDRLIKANKAHEDVCAYLRDNWDWLLGHADFYKTDFGELRYKEYVFTDESKEEDHCFLKVRRHDDGRMEVNAPHSLKTGFAETIGLDESYVSYRLVKTRYTNLRSCVYSLIRHPQEWYRKLTPDGLHEDESRLHDYETYYREIVPFFLHALMKYCLGKANERMNRFLEAEKRLAEDGAKVDANTAKYDIKKEQ